MAPASSPLRIDIVSDVMCPWCIIGYRQLERALQLRGDTAEVFWHPFELNPDMPPEGQDLREHLAEKYGTTPEQSRGVRERLVAMGQELGFTFTYGDDMRIWNTFDAHQLIHWAAGQDRAHQMKIALFAAHFTDGRNVADHAVLADVAAGIGLDRDAALQVLADQTHAAEVRERERFWTSQGITGVPAVVFDAKHLVTGAQGVENYVRILEQVQSLRAA
jgi:predicted DsbA family dithiol-disulfide isomerase